MVMENLIDKYIIVTVYDNYYRDWDYNLKRYEKTNSNYKLD